MLLHKLLESPVRRYITYAVAAMGVVLIAVSGYWTARHAWAKECGARDGSVRGGQTDRTRPTASSLTDSDGTV